MPVVKLWGHVIVYVTEQQERIKERTCSRLSDGHKFVSLHQRKNKTRITTQLRKDTSMDNTGYQGYALPSQYSYGRAVASPNSDYPMDISPSPGGRSADRLQAPQTPTAD